MPKGFRCFLQSGLSLAAIISYFARGIGFPFSSCAQHAVVAPPAAADTLCRTWNHSYDEDIHAEFSLLQRDLIVSNGTARSASFEMAGNHLLQARVENHRNIISAALVILLVALAFFVVLAVVGIVLHCIHSEGVEIGLAADITEIEMDNLDPMSVETYQLIYKAQGRNVIHELPDGAQGDTEFTPMELALRMDFLRAKMCWSSNYRRDWWCSMRNFNPLIALCYSHPLHPISRRERTVVYCVQLMFVTLVSCWLASSEACLLCDVECHAGQVGFAINATGHLGESCSAESAVVNYQGCCVNKPEVAEWFLTSTPPLWIGSYKVYVGGTLYSALGNCIFSFFSFQLMICGCGQNLNWQRRQRCDCLGHVVYGVFAAGLLTLSAQFICRFQESGRFFISAIINFIGAKLGAFVGITIIGTVAFEILWSIQTPSKNDDTWLRHFDSRRDKEDTRNMIARLANPIFSVSAHDYLSYLQSLHSQAGRLDTSGKNPSPGQACMRCPCPCK